MKIKKLFIAAILLQLFAVSYFAQVKESPEAIPVAAFRFDNKEKLMLELDNLAVQLQNDPNAISYIFIYGNERTAAKTGKEIMDYVVKKRNLDPARFVIKNADGGATAEIELYLVPEGAEPPVPVVKEKPEAIKFDQFRFANQEDFMARFDAFHVQLQSNPDGSAYIIINGNEPARASALKETKGYMKMRMTETGRFVLLQGKGETKAEIEFWLVPTDAEPPVAKMPVAEVFKDGSVYSDLKPENCKKGDYHKSVPGLFFAVCKGVAGYDLEYYLDDERNSLGVAFPSKKVVGLDFWTYFGEFSELGEKAEWRIKNNKPIALIVRLNISDFDDWTKKTSYLIVSKIGNETACVTDIVKPGKNQNVTARQLADKASTKPCKKGRLD